MTDISQIEGATVLGDQVIGTFSTGDAASAAPQEAAAPAASNSGGAVKVIDIIVPVLPESVADATVAS